VPRNSRSRRYSPRYQLLRVLLRDRMFVVGLAILTLLVAMALGGYIWVPEDARTRWYYNVRWTLNPKLAPPCWADYLTYESRVPTANLTYVAVSEYWQVRAEEVWQVRYRELTSMGITDENILSRLREDTYRRVKEELESRGLSYLFEYSYTWSTPPQDLALVVRSLSRDLVASVSMAVYRPDGAQVRFPLSDRVELHRGEESIVKVSFSKDFVERLIRDYLSARTDPETLRVLSDQINYGLRSPVSVLFYEDLGSGGRVSLATPTLGVYRMRVDLVFSEPAEAVELEVKLRVIGSCYGLLGTDDMGRDNLWTLLAGSAIALLIGLPYALASRLIGLLYGATSGFFGGTVVDMVMQRICEIIYAMPTLPFIIMISYTLRETTGTQIGIFQIIALLLIFGWSGVAIVSRSMALSIREEPYVEAAKAMGASRARVILRYIVPQLMPYFFASVMLATPGAILTEVFLSILGLTDPNMPSWGKMISGAQLTVHAWWWIIPPGVAITLTGLAFMFLGYSIESATNPKRRRL